MRYPRYTTYREGQLVAEVRKMDPTGTAAIAPGQFRQNGNGRSRLLKSHRCAVTYPDGTEGTCEYTRGGPAWHVFKFHHRGHEGDTCPLPVQHYSSRMENTPAAIESRAHILSASAFQEAIQSELRDYFRRAIPPNGRILEAFACQMSVERAKEIGGRYALCLRLGDKVIPTSGHFDTLDQANEAWKGKGDGKLLVGCACRWSRRWELPRFNPLYRDERYARE